LDSLICEELMRQADLRCGECDCVKLKAFIGVAVATLAAIIAVRGRNKAAMKEAQKAIQKAMESSRRAANAETLEEMGIIMGEVDSFLAIAAELLDGEQEIMFEFDTTLEEFEATTKRIEVEAFYDVEAGTPGEVVISP